MGFKNWILNICHMSSRKIFKILSFFQERGLRGSTNENFEKQISDFKWASKIGYKTCATLPKRKKKLQRNPSIYV